MMRVKPTDSGNQSCSCTSCLYKSESEQPSVRKYITHGSRHDRLFSGKHIPLRERKLLNRLVRTRAVYDDLRAQLISGSTLSLDKNADLRPRKHHHAIKTFDTQKSDPILELVDIIDKGVALDPKKISECCSCCSCSSQPKFLERDLKTHRYRRTYSRGVAKKYGPRVQGRVGERWYNRSGARLKAKLIRSEPCTCTFKFSGLIKRHSKALFDKIHPAPQEPFQATEEPIIESKSKLKKTTRKLHRKYKDMIEQDRRKLMESREKMKHNLQLYAKKSVEQVKHIKNKLKTTIGPVVTNSIQAVKALKPKDKTFEYLEQYPIDETTFNIKKDSIAKFKDYLKRKEIMKDWECDFECSPDTCVPKECFKILKLKRLLKRNQQRDHKYTTEDEMLHRNVKVGHKSLRKSSSGIQAKKLALGKATHIKKQKPMLHVEGGNKGIGQRHMIEPEDVNTGGTNEVVKAKANIPRADVESPAPFVSDYFLPGVRRPERKYENKRLMKNYKSDKRRRQALHRRLSKSEVIATVSKTSSRSTRYSISKYAPRLKRKDHSRQRGTQSILKIKPSFESSKYALKVKQKKHFAVNENPLPSKQAVRIGSTFSFSVEFYKDTNNEVNTSSTREKVKQIHSRSSPVPPKTFKDNLVKSNYKDAKNTLNRCFCILKLRTFGKPRRRIKTSTIGTVTSFNSNMNGPRIVTKYQLHPYECEPGICIPYQCDPVLCSKILALRNRKKKRPIYKESYTNSRKTKSTSSIASKGKAKVKVQRKSIKRRPLKKPNMLAADTQTLRQTLTAETMNRGTKTKRKLNYDLLPFECEPSICEPGQCDPYMCIKEMIRRKLSTRDYGMGTAKPKKKSVSSFIEIPIKRSTAIEAEPELFFRGANIKRNYIKPLDRKLSGIAPYTDGSGETSRYSNSKQAVKIGSSFNFSVEFFKELPQTLNKEVKRQSTKSRPKMFRNKGIKVAKIQVYHADTQSQKVTKSHRLSLVHLMLKRCFCTLNLYKKTKQQYLKGLQPSLTFRNKYFAPQMYTANRATRTSTRTELIPFQNFDQSDELFNHKKNIQSISTSSNLFQNYARSVSRHTRINLCPDFKIPLAFRQPLKLSSNLSVEVQFIRKFCPPESNNIPMKSFSYAYLHNKPEECANFIQPFIHNKKSKCGNNLERCYCTMNVQILHEREARRKHVTNQLKPYECEPGVCVPGECDPYECQKLIMKRFTKNLNKGSSTETVSKSVTSYVSHLGSPSRSTQFKKHVRNQLQESGQRQYRPQSLRENKPRQVVRIGSNFSFNVDFSKSGPPAKDIINYDRRYNNRDDSSRYYERPVKYKNSKVSTRTSKMRLVHKSSNYAANMKRCFCTLKLQKKGRIHQDKLKQHVQQLPSVTSRNIKAGTGKTKYHHIPITDFYNLKPYECEPGICVPGQCNPYECLEIIKRRKNVGMSTRSEDRSISSMTSEGGNFKRKYKTRAVYVRPKHTYQSRTVKNQKKIAKTVDSERRSRQAVRISSNFSFNVGFSRDTSNTPEDIKIQNTRAAYIDGNKNRHRKEGKGTYSEKIQDYERIGGTRERTNYHIDGNQKRHRKRVNSSNSQSNIGFSHKLTQMEEPNHHKTSKFMERCFCLLGLRKQSTKNHQSAVSGTQFADKETITRNKHKFRMSRLEPYECEPGICIPDHCDPYLCQKIIQRRLANQYSKASETDSSKTQSVSSNYKYIKKPRNVKTNAKYNGYIKKPRNKRAQAQDFEHYQNDNFISKKILPEKSTVNADRRVVRIGSNFNFNVEFYKENVSDNETIGKARHTNIYSNSREANSYRNPRQTNTYSSPRKTDTNLNPSESITRTNTSHHNITKENRKKQVGIERMSAKRNRINQNGIKSKIPKKNRNKNVGIESRSMSTSRLKQLKNKEINKKSSGVSRLIKRCFCTLKLLNRTVDRDNKIHKVNSISIAERNIGTQSHGPLLKQPLHNEQGPVYLSPYECEPFTCIPGECDPVECLERIKKRQQYTKDISTFTGHPRRKTAGTFASRRTKNDRSQAKFVSTRLNKHIRKTNGKANVKPENYTDTSKQAIRIGSNFSFNIEFFKDNPASAGRSNLRTEDMNMRKSSNKTEHFHKYNQSAYVDENADTQTTSPKIWSAHTRQALRNKELEKIGNTNVETYPYNVYYSPKSEHSAVDQFLKKCKCTLQLNKLGKLHKEVATPAVRYEIKGTSTYNRSARFNPILKPTTTLEDYECEPNICVPGECDPYECLKRIQKRQFRDFGTEYKRNLKNSGTYPIRQPLMMCKDTQCFQDKKLYSRATSFPTQRKRHSKEVTQRPPHLSDNTNKQAVRIGSNFSFNIEFFKEHEPEQNQHNVHRNLNAERAPNIKTRSEIRTGRSRGSYIKKTKLHCQGSQCPFLKRPYTSSATNTSPPRCFCTSKFFRVPNNYSSQVKPFQPEPKTEYKATETKNKYMIPHELGVYECPPLMCIPGECDPYECLYKIKRGIYKSQSVGTRPSRRSTAAVGNGGMKRRTHKTQASVLNKGHITSTLNLPRSDIFKSPQFTQNMNKRNKRAVRIGSNFNFDIEFFKNRTLPNVIHTSSSNIVRAREEQTDSKSYLSKPVTANAGTYRHHDSQTVFTTAKNMASDTGNTLKRCFCTLQLQKPRHGRMSSNNMSPTGVKVRYPQTFTVGRVAIESKNQIKFKNLWSRNKECQNNSRSVATKTEKKHLRNDEFLLPCNCSYHLRKMSLEKGKNNDIVSIFPYTPKKFNKKESKTLIANKNHLNKISSQSKIKTVKGNKQRDMLLNKSKRLPIKKSNESINMMDRRCSFNKSFLCLCSRLFSKSLPTALIPKKSKSVKLTKEIVQKCPCIKHSDKNNYYSSKFCDGDKRSNIKPVTNKTNMLYDKKPASQLNKKSRFKRSKQRVTFADSAKCPTADIPEQKRKNQKRQKSSTLPKSYSICECPCNTNNFKSGHKKNSESVYKCCQYCNVCKRKMDVCEIRKGAGDKASTSLQHVSRDVVKKDDKTRISGIKNSQLIQRLKKKTIRQFQGAKLSVPAKGTTSTIGGFFGKLLPPRKPSDIPCVCGSKKCAKKLNERSIVIRLGKPCVCGSPICPKESKKMRRKKKEHICKCRAVMKKRQTDLKSKKQRLKNFKELYGIEIERDKKRRNKRIQRNKKLEKKVRKLKDSSDIVLAASSLIDIAKLGFSTVGDGLSSTVKAIRNPRYTYGKMKHKHTNFDTKYALKNLTKTLKESDVTATAKRVKLRFLFMRKYKTLRQKLEEYRYSHYLLHLADRKPKTRVFKPKRSPREPVDFNCSLYMTSLRRRPCLCVYNRWPWFYPHLITMLNLWKQFTDVTLFLLAVVVWSPCILCMEACRALTCCFFCTG